MRLSLLAILVSLAAFCSINNFYFAQTNTLNPAPLNRAQDAVISETQLFTNANLLTADRYYIRVSGCDDGGKAYLNNTLIVDVGFDEDSNWLDITEDVAQGKDEIKFEAINKTGAITYVFQVKKNDKIIYEQSCGKAKEIGCENNRAFRVGKARKFTYNIGRNES